MKKRFIAAVLAAGLTFTGCGATKQTVTDTEVFQDGEVQTQDAAQSETQMQEKETQETESPIKIEITSEHHEGTSDESRKDIKYTYEYEQPIVSISGNEEAQNAIQSDLDSYIDSFLGSLESGYFGVVYEDGAETSYQAVGMQVLRADEQVIRIMMTNEGYDGGAHGWLTMEYFNYFTATGEKITFDKLGEGFRERAEQLVRVKAKQMQQEEQCFFEDYQKSIPLVVLDGTEDRNEVYTSIYGDTWSDMESEPMIPTFYITDTGFGFTSGQYVLQPYAGGIIDFTFTAADFGDALEADIFTDAGAGERTIGEEQINAVEEEAADAISEEEYETFTKTADAVDAGGFDDFNETMNQDFTGTWYDPEMGEAIRLTSQGAYVYIPYLDLYGDELYEWELIDRSAKGLCPELAIYFNGRDVGPLAYYVAGIRDNYFWCNAQSQIFYRQ